MQFVRAVAVLLLTRLITGAQTTAAGTLQVTVTVNPSVAVVFDPRTAGETATIACANGGALAFANASDQGDLMAIQLALNSPAPPEPVRTAGTSAIRIQGRSAFESRVRPLPSFGAVPAPVIHSWSGRQKRRWQAAQRGAIGVSMALPPPTSGELALDQLLETGALIAQTNLAVQFPDFQFKHEPSAMGWGRDHGDTPRSVGTVPSFERLVLAGGQAEAERPGFP